MNLTEFKVVRRGYIPDDKKFFKNENLAKVKKAALEISFLINRGYNIKNASTFVGNHYLLSERQRLFLARALSSKKDIESRHLKELTLDDLKGENISIDGFNTIITLETALSNSMIFKGEDNTIRDLAGLRGTYKIIDKTIHALKLIFDSLNEFQIKRVEFYLDKPVSNSGRLKELIIYMSKDYNFETEVFLIEAVDSLLEKKEYVISSDAIILNKCISWFNLNAYIINKKIQEVFCIDIFPLSY